jgi:hypothetical protein
VKTRCPGGVARFLPGAEKYFGKSSEFRARRLTDLPFYGKLYAVTLSVL